MKRTDRQTEGRFRAQAGSPQSRVTRGLLSFACGFRKGPHTPGQERAGQWPTQKVRRALCGGMGRMAGRRLAQDPHASAHGDALTMASGEKEAEAVV